MPDDRGTGVGELMPLSEIAKQLGKKPCYLASLARDGAITAEKRNNRWYASRERVKKELRKRLWSRVGVNLELRISDFADFVIGLLQFALAYGFIFVIFTLVVREFGEFEIVIDSSPFSTPLILTILMYILGALSRATRTVEHAGQFWERVTRYHGQVYDLKERVELLERSLSELSKQVCEQGDSSFSL